MRHHLVHALEMARAKIRRDGCFWVNQHEIPCYVESYLYGRPIRCRRGWYKVFDKQLVLDRIAEIDKQIDEWKEDNRIAA